MGPVIYLLGIPRIVRDGQLRILRGRKAWGLLAYLVRHPQGVVRQQLASLLFEDAQDPLAALRWNLSELRRALGDAGLKGHVIALTPDSTAYRDIDVLTRGDWSDALSVPGLGQELLGGMSFAASPGFEVWLESERRLLRATAQCVLREAALARLAAGAAVDAAALAAKLVALDPFDETFQVLLVRCLGASGDGVAAARQAAACRELFMRELGVMPGPALAAALHTGTAATTARPLAGRAGITAQLQAGEAAISAGVLDAGLQCLRRAIADSDAFGDPELRVRTRLALGGALVHAARGRDEEGAAALHEALALGQGMANVHAAGACRELGYVEMLRGSYERAMAWMDRGVQLAAEDRAEQARIATVRGTILSDTAHYGDAIETLEYAAGLSDSLGDIKQLIFATSMLGRTMLLRGDVDTAVRILTITTAQARGMWTAFLPWPQSLLAECELLHDRHDAAAELFEQAFALGCQLGDPCWEGMAGRGLGMVAMARGQHEQAKRILLDAIVRCTRLSDGYLWTKAHALDGLCRLGTVVNLPQTRQWTDDLMTLASRTGMRELVVRACLHQVALGDSSALGAARAMAGEIDSPFLQASAQEFGFMNMLRTPTG